MRYCGQDILNSHWPDSQRLNDQKGKLLNSTHDFLEKRELELSTLMGSNLCISYMPRKTVDLTVDCTKASVYQSI